MKERISLSVIVITLCIASMVLAKGADRKPNWWLLGTPLYGEVPTTTEAKPNIMTLRGKVAEVEPVKGLTESRQMRLTTPQGEQWVVILGPSWFVENQRMRFNPGDQVEVRGAKILELGQNNLVAEDIMKDNLTMKLRNKDGLPAWDCCFPRQWGVR